MRFLFVDAHYQAYLDAIYAAAPDLGRAAYVDQVAAIRHGLFGEAQFQAQALRDMGHEADVVVTNAHEAQQQWARERGMVVGAAGGWSLRRRRGVVPWISRRTVLPAWDVAVEQVRVFRPDVVYVEILDTLPTNIVSEFRRYSRHVVAQVATTIPEGDYRAYDLIISSIPSIVERFRAIGIRSEWIPLAFEPDLLHKSPPHRDIEVSFVGSFSSAYDDREALVEAVAMVAPLKTWTADASRLPAGSRVLGTIQGAAFGRHMYDVLGRSHITLNSHGRISAGSANNLRLFEATGMGALLITDERNDLERLFAPGREIVTYRTPSEAAEATLYYLANPREAAAIAAAGQRRTLQDHTWADRMAWTANVIEELG